MLNYQSKTWAARYCRVKVISSIALTNLLDRAHTLDEVTYSNYLRDGQVIGTLNNTKVRVSIRGEDIFFNNAKVIEANVLTNNGLIHMQVIPPI